MGIQKAEAQATKAQQRLRYSEKQDELRASPNGGSLRPAHHPRRIRMRDLTKEYDFISFICDNSKKSWKWEVVAYNNDPVKGFIHMGYGVGQDMAEVHDRFKTTEERRRKKKKRQMKLELDER